MKLKKGMKVLLKSRVQIADELTPMVQPEGMFIFHNVVYTPTMIKNLGKVVTINHVRKNKSNPELFFEADGFIYNEQIIECIIEDEKEYDFSTPLGIIHCTLQLAKTIACGYMTMSMLGADHYSCLADPLLGQIESIETKEE